MCRTVCCKVKSKKPIAIELELTLKEPTKRLEGNRRRLSSTATSSAVWYFVTSDQQIRRRLTSIIDGERLFKIKPLASRAS